MHLNRLFTTAPNAPYLGINFTERTSTIRGLDGRVVAESTIFAPSEWSQMAVDILAQKYMRRAGVPADTQTVPEDGVPEWLQRSEPVLGTEYGAETDARQVFERLAGCWTYWAWKSGHFVDELFTDREAQAQIFHDELLFMLANQMAAPNSPQWFNTGLHWSYGITRPPQGHWFVADEGGAPRKSVDAYSRPQPHACFIQSVEDDLVNGGGIMDLWTREARIFKYGSGTGTNFSSLRGKGEPLSGGGRSSGLLTFLKIGDVSAGAIKSGGTTRRAAKMVIIDIDHPDIEEFVGWKAREENKVAALYAGSRLLHRTLNSILNASDEELDEAVLDAMESDVPSGMIKRTLDARSSGANLPTIEPMGLGFEEEAYTTVSGQNSNNSVRVPDEFMQALEAGDVWALRRRTDGAIDQEISASALWDQIVNAAWACADPGLQFDDTINRWHTCPNEGKIRGSNPCAEYLFLDDTACNLASLNLVKLLGLPNYLEAFEHATRLWTRVLDVSVSMAQLPSRAIALRTHQTRTLGLGFANLGALLMRLGLPYDSDLARDVAASIASLMSGVAYRESAVMAQEIASFPAYANNHHPMQHVIREHRRHADRLLSTAQHDLANELAATALKAWDNALTTSNVLRGEHAGPVGFRNAQATLLAPTGTIALLMDCDTTGIEPDYALIKLKKLAGGGFFRIVNESVTPALQARGYDDQTVADIVTRLRGTGRLPEELRDRLSSLSAERIHEIEQALGSSPEIEVALLGLSPVELDSLGVRDSDGSLLRRLLPNGNYSALNNEACGTMALDGLIRPEHLPIFDCSVPCGDSGRSIAWEGHITMMAAVQPFLSGGISKTVNMPGDSTPKDVARAYTMAWQMGIKCIALYRDGCKLSQPLNASLLSGRSSHTAAVKAVVAAATGRRPMPNTRRGTTQKLRVGGQKLYVRTGEYDDGSLGEVFITLPGEGTTMRSIFNQFAIAISVALQYGVPLDHLVKIFSFASFEPSGRVEHHPRLRRANSIIDAVFRHLGWAYDGRDDLMHVEAEESGMVPSASPTITVPAPSSESADRSFNYTGDLCPDCSGPRMVRAGTCSYCLDCGDSTGGCS